jgi:hypothetical protein
MAPPGYLDLREARRRVGPRAVPGWQKEGADEFAPSAGEDAAEMRAIAEMDDRQLKAAARARRREIVRQEQRERAAGAAQSGRKEGAEKLRVKIPELVKAFEPPPRYSDRQKQLARREYRSRLEKLLASLETPAMPTATAKPRAGRYTRAELEATRAWLMDEATARHEQHQAARLRWAAADRIVRDKATAGEWRVLAQLAPPLAEVVSLTADQLPALWPKANETLVTMPYDGMSWRARLLIAEAEIDRDFPAEVPTTASSAPESDAMFASNGLSATAKSDATTVQQESSGAPAPMTQEAVRIAQFKEFEELRGRGELPSMRQTARYLAQFAERLKGNTEQYGTNPETLRTSEYFKRLYRDAGGGGVKP